MARRPSNRELRAAFDFFNDYLFAGRLPRARLVSVYDPAPSAVGGWCQEPGHGGSLGTIGINVASKPARVCGWRGTLLHEMVHLAIGVVDATEWEDGEVFGHGDLFVAVCNMVGSKLGLPTSTTDDAWMWPDTLFWNDEWEPNEVE